MKSDSLTKMVVHNKSLLFKKVRDNILFFVLSKGYNRHFQNSTPK